MADFLNNIVNNNPLPTNAGQSLGKIADASSLIPGNFEIPKIPNPNDVLSGLAGKIPNKELADKAAAKFKELQDKFNKLKKTKVNIKKPKPFKPKEIPLPKKFKKAELEKLKGLQGKIGSLKDQAQSLTGKAKGAMQNIQSQAQGLASQAQGAISGVQSTASQLQSGVQNSLNQIPNLPKV